MCARIRRCRLIMHLPTDSGPDPDYGGAGRDYHAKSEILLICQELTRLQARTEGRLAAALSHSKDAKHKSTTQDRQLQGLRRTNEKLTAERDTLEVRHADPCLEWLFEPLDVRGEIIWEQTAI